MLVIFDLDNTLVDRARFFREWAQLFTDDRNLGASGVQWLHEADEDGVSARMVLFERTRERFELPESVEELVDAYWRDQLQRYRCEPDTVEALRGLRRSGYRIGIATNGGSAQSKKIVAAGLDALVDGWCVSREVGYAKPDRQLFEAVATRCGASLDGAWVVGDRPEADIAGAVSIGARSVWITRGGEWTESTYRPTLTARTPSEAIAQIVSA
ncbi:MAG: putative hydrolase of the superfamily [Chloroflexota bacterium]|jgi:putative hydrolase of the HAD superfamily|nr:putative hydrolase of the superfamily [Chloroflexota bacterium]